MFFKKPLLIRSDAAPGHRTDGSPHDEINLLIANQQVRARPWPLHYLLAVFHTKLNPLSFLFSFKLSTQSNMSYKIAYDAALAPPRGPAIVAFMEDFYRTSDTESLHEKYVQSFTEDATLIMGPKEAKGATGMFTIHGLAGHVCKSMQMEPRYLHARLSCVMLYSDLDTF